MKPTPAPLCFTASTTNVTPLPGPLYSARAVPRLQRCRSQVHHCRQGCHRAKSRTPKESEKSSWNTRIRFALSGRPSDIDLCVPAAALSSAQASHLDWLQPLVPKSTIQVQQATDGLPPLDRIWRKSQPQRVPESALELDFQHVVVPELPKLYDLLPTSFHVE